MNKNTEKVRNLSLDELLKRCVHYLKKEKNRYSKNLDYYENQIVNSDKSEAEKQRIGERLYHDYWRSLLLEELFGRIDTKAIIPFLGGLDEAKKQMELTGKKEFYLIYHSKTGKVNVN